MSTTPFSCAWDSGQVGFIYTTRERVLEAYGSKRLTQRLRDQAEDVLRSEVAVYDQYLRGDVYSFAIQNIFGDVIDGVSGFYGSSLKESGMEDYLPENWKELEVIAPDYFGINQLQ